MKKIIISVSIIAAAAAVVIGATTAYFSDTETSTGNTFTAGSIDLKVDSKCTFNGVPQPFCTWSLKDLTTEKFFNYSDLKPGDSGENTISLHVYSNDAWACMTVTPVSNNDVTCTEPECVAEGSTGCENPAGKCGIDSGTGELAQNLSGMIWADVGKPIPIVTECDNAYPGDNIFQTACGDRLIGTGIAPLAKVVLPLADKNGNVFTGTVGPLIGSNDYYLGVSWSLPWTTGNIVQSDSYVADISFYTVQARNNANFQCGQ
jgi:predicted ribosomally synthesized peptide with SipW-like signal peptide